MALHAHPAERVVLAPRERRRAVLDVIGSARQRLILSLYRCDDRRVLEALAAACRRGVRVEALVTRRSKDRSNLKLLRLLLEYLGVRVWRYADPFVKYHAKYVVADDRRALVGSLNFTRECFKKTSASNLDARREVGLVVRHPQCVGPLLEFFHQVALREPTGVSTCERMESAA